MAPNTAMLRRTLPITGAASLPPSTNHSVIMMARPSADPVRRARRGASCAPRAFSRALPESSLTGRARRPGARGQRRWREKLAISPESAMSPSGMAPALPYKARKPSRIGSPDVPSLKGADPAERRVDRRDQEGRNGKCHEREQDSPRHVAPAGRSIFGRQWQLFDREI